MAATNSINSTYASDPAPARGLLAQANRYSFYLALSDAVPGVASRDVGKIRSTFAAGSRFDHLHYLITRTSPDMPAC
jgi:hypothetical protein